ncbi:MAG TPA: hypothetical protein PLQ88_30010, partial [Blastocatellia bacterium]|nr:hypothetical protein [Blastocatellia bacterium]
NSVEQSESPVRRIAKAAKALKSLLSYSRFYSFGAVARVLFNKFLAVKQHASGFFKSVGFD